MFKAWRPIFISFMKKGQAAAGTRVRKGLSELKNLCQDVRKNVQDVKAKEKLQNS